MAALTYHIMSKDVEKVRNCRFVLLAHSLLLPNTQELTNYVGKIAELSHIRRTDSLLGVFLS